jgi:hypothetical protein
MDDEGLRGKDGIGVGGERGRVGVGGDKGDDGVGDVVNGLIEGDSIMVIGKVVVLCKRL